MNRPEELAGGPKRTGHFPRIDHCPFFAKKRSQMEIMGLAVIVILISIAILFALNTILKQPSAYKKDFTQTELASNMLSSMLRTTYPQCNKMSLTELFQHCVRNEFSSDTVCGDKTSCRFIGKVDTPPYAYTDGEVKSIFDNTFGAWNIRYEFIAKTPAKVYMKSGTPCKAGFKSKQYPIPVDPTGQNTLFITLNICD
ncbi:hypothetical protein HYU14_00320 [Candidatus Woesearchaeota archaeon]|nr:hypothetical protein [Candidatus Woesearchaeota archaeon]